MLRTCTRRTDVRGGTPVLEVAEALSTDVTGNTNGSTTVGNARAEGTDVASFVATGETKVVVLAIHSDVLVVPLGELLDGSFDELHTSGLTHSLSAVVGVATSTIPVTLKRLRVEGDLDAPLLSDADEEVTSHPEVVAHGDTFARSDLEFPLGGHDLGVDSGNVDSSVEASTVVSLDQVTGKYLAGTCQTKLFGVRSLQLLRCFS